MQSMSEYSDYRKYLIDYIHHQPNRGRGLISKISAAIGIHVSLLSLILKGERELSEEQAFDICEHFEFSDLDRRYFLLMVRHSRAGNPRLRGQIEKDIAEVKQQYFKASEVMDYDHVLSDEEKAIFYSRWYYPAIRQFCAIGKTGRSFEEISEHFKISRRKLSPVMDFLVRKQLCLEAEGLYRIGPKRTFLEVNSPFLLQYLTQWRSKALAQYENIRDDEVAFTGVISVSLADYETIRLQIMELLKNVSRIANETEEEAVAAINIDFFQVRA